MELAKSFEPADIERRWYPSWEDHGYFKAGLDTAKQDAFCILLPPPNVTGTLHMGHGFNQTLMDALTRYHRMRGDNTLWQPGTDHAGIATQIVVERQLDAQGISRHDLGRDKFLDKVWEWKEYSGNTITKQMRRLGTSPDWSRERFTMDAGLCQVVTETFVRLYREGLIYRGKRLVNWDPKLLTAVSDLEVVSEEEDGFMWEIRYPFVDGEGGLVVATTRPETMLGDVAVAVNPDDERYRHLVGKEVQLRSPAAASPSSPMPTWTRSSAPAASRSRRPTTSTTGRLAIATSSIPSASSPWTPASMSTARNAIAAWIATKPGGRSSPTWTSTACWSASSPTS